MNFHSRLARQLAQPNVRRSLIMAGALTAAGILGQNGPEALAFVIDGMRSISMSFPFMRPEASMATWIEGGMNWLSAVGTGLAGWCQSTGAELCSRTVEALSQMRHHLGDKADFAARLFDQSLSRSAEVSALLRDALRNSLPQTPVDAAKAAVGALTKVAEAWGIWTAFREIGAAVLPRIRARFGSSGMIRAAARESGIPEPAVTTININIAIAGEANREKVLETVRSGLEAAGLSEPTTGAGVSTAIQRPTHGAATDTGRPLPSFVCGEDIIWASEELSRSMMDGVSDTAILRGSAKFAPLSRIEGGILLREIPKDHAKKSFELPVKNDTIDQDSMNLQ